MKQLFTVIALFISYCSFSQNAEISGKITDVNTKEPIGGSSVRYDRGKGVIADANGKVVATHSGYVEGDEFVVEEELQKLVKK